MKARKLQSVAAMKELLQAKRPEVEDREEEEQWLLWDPSTAIERARSRSMSWRGRKRERSSGMEENVDAMDIDQPNKKHCMLSRSKSRSRPPGEVTPGEVFKDSSQKLKAVKLGKKAVKK